MSRSTGIHGTNINARVSTIIRSHTCASAFSEVEKFLKTLVKRYSPGMYVPLAFAVAAHLEPEILIEERVGISLPE